MEVLLRLLDRQDLQATGWRTDTDFPALSVQRLAIVTPMANERRTAVEFVSQMLAEAAVFREVAHCVVLDRASTDGTMDVLKEFAREEPRLRIVWAPENRGVVDAYVRGYKEALATRFEWILEVDAGFSHQPQDLRQFFPAMAENHECIFGSRFRAEGGISESSVIRYIISRGGSILTNLLLGTPFSDMTSGYQMFQRHALKAVLDRGIVSRAHFFQTEMKVYCRHMRCAEVPIHYSAASQSMNAVVLADAFGRLFSLFGQRLAGRL